MKTSTKNCQNCKQDFIIEAEDFDFYKRIDVPAPVFCPDCRMQMRLIWRNEHSLYRRKCSAPGHSEDIISIYPPEKHLAVYDHDYWFSDNWDATEFGVDYDFDRPFFEQYNELLKKVPHIALFDSKSVDSSYCNITVEQKNSYLVTAGWANEDSMYSNRISYCKETADSYACHKIEFGYDNVGCKDSYKLFFSLNSQDCSESYFLYDCKNCSNCIGSTNLRNKKYHIFNKPYSKEEYEEKVKELRLDTREGLAKAKEEFQKQYLESIHRFANLINTENVIGDNIENSKNCYYCFDLPGEAENSKYCHWATYGLRDSYDTGPGTGGNSELLYEGISIGVNNANCKFGVIVWYSHDIQYGFNCHDSQYLFGCVGVRNKDYCILNKKYSKEEYEELVPKIKKHMEEMPYTDSKGRVYKYGSFFPPELSPWAYNETAAQDYVPLSKERAEEQGYVWREDQKAGHRATISADKFSSIADVGDDVLDETFGCKDKGECIHNCSSAYKITPQELRFYKRMNLPLPELCFKCRHYRRLERRNPLKLWSRQCMCELDNHEHNRQCENEFQTSYAPDRPENVYCDACYQKEIF